MIDLTPLEVRKKKGDFRRVLRGYDASLVDDFLDLVADRIEQLVRDNSAMAERLTELERRVGEYRDRERALTDALVTAQEMREEIRVQTTREAELTRRTSTQEAESRLREAEQRAEALVRDAEQRSQELLRAAEQRAQTLVRESEQHTANTIRAAEQGADDTLRRAQQEAEAQLRQAHQEATTLHAELVQVREREEETLRRLRLHQQQQLSLYRNFLERELAELDIIVRSVSEETAQEAGVVRRADAEAVALAEPESGEGSAAGGEASAAGAELRTGQARDTRAAAAAAVLAQSFLAEEPERFLGDELRAEIDVEPAASEPLDSDAFETEPFEPKPFEPEPFEPEPVYDEDLQPRALRQEPSMLLSGEEAVAEELPGGEDDSDTEALLENAALAGYHLDLVDDLEDGPDGPELLLEEPAPEPGQDDDDDWLSSIIDDKQ